jgi:mRNA-binding protein PUF3
MKVLNEILSKSGELITDQYGNYVIQHIIEKVGSEKCQKIYNLLNGKIFEYSVHKFASNVVEKCLTFGNDRQRKKIIDEIITREEYIYIY